MLAPALRHVLDLDDARARDPAVAGAKAATLARARAAGLPCLPGWVVPVAEGRETLRRGADSLVAGGSGRARLLVMDTPPGSGVRDELAGLVRALDGPVVVRSSSVAEDDPLWAGAFGSFDAIGVSDVATAVSGVWASAFTVDALRRCAEVGVPVAGGGLAVLVQPRLTGPGGSARLLPGGAVEVTAIRGVPGSMSRRGLRATVEVSGAAHGPAADTLGAERVAAVARLARRVVEVLGLDLIEWGWADGAAVLLQARRAAVRIASPARRTPPSPALATEQARRVAGLATGFPGPLGESLVLAWALGCTRLPAPDPAPVADPARALTVTALLAGVLTAQAWGLPPQQARQEARRVLAAVRGPHPDAAFDRLAGLADPDADAACRVRALLAGLAEAMVEAGLVASPDEVWRHDEHGLRRILAADTSAPPVRRGPDRWEPFLYRVVAAQGRPVTGVAAAPGAAAGPVRVIAPPIEPGPRGHREVLVTRHPLPELASLLWSAAALVTGPGDPGAHLFEVAACLGVPAVVDVDVRSLCADGRRVSAAVDGASGTVWTLDLQRRADVGRR